MSSTSHISESEESYNSSNFYEIEDNGMLSVNVEEMKTEERRLKSLHAKEERAALRKLKEEENLKEKKEKAIKSMTYLLNTSQKYSKFFLDKFKSYDISMDNKPRNRKPLSEKKSATNQEENDSYEQQIEELEKKQATLNNNIDEQEPEKKRESIKKPMKIPKYFSGGILQPHQIDGLVWLKLLFENGVNGILADEMGLGKTIQVIALICYLMEKKVPGPYLIVAPLSTIPNWISEFNRFAPKIPVVLFHGSIEERQRKYKEVMKKTYEIDNHETSPVVVTSYQVPMSETRFLQRFKWQYIIIDEGHRIKNHECRLMKDLKSLVSLNRLLLTGTPLQNNLVELWSLLNFLLPQFFRDVDTFASLLVSEDFKETGRIIKQEKSTNIISTIHGVLNPFMLRRLKCDVLKDMAPKKEVLVYCPLSQLQRDLYKFILQRNMNQLLGIKEEKEIDLDGGRPKRKCIANKKYREHESDEEVDEDSADIIDNISRYSLKKQDGKTFVAQIKMSNPVMMYKRVVNHPYLVHFPLIPKTRELLIDEKIIEHSGKMRVLDAMLVKLKERGHKVLIFSTLKIMLDLIEDYLNIRKYFYCRLDGSMKLEQRQECIKDFNTNPEIFTFLISTRAGGLGINLTAADTVILFDRDWNPQADIQAQDRCHRIGQTKPVMVYTFITKGTFDEHILNISTRKRKLEKVVISKGKFKSPEESYQSVTDLAELERLLSADDHSLVIQSNGFVLSDEELDKLLDRSELYKEMELKAKMS